ncbi:MAG: recombinase family protein [Lachnospiraceae bacterium]|nr:recombinase family protein [Lachnospiraceae bacterium]
MPKRKQVPFNDNNLAIGYYRFSSSGQDTSIEQQREAAHKYAEAHGFTIIREYDDPAISGTTADRPKFQQMLSEIGDLRPAALILWKTDRLSRDNYDVAIAKRKIRDAGCRIHYVAEKTPDGSPEDELMEGFLEKMATYYSRQLSVNVKRGQKYNAERGLYLGKRILGYATEGEGRHNKRYVIDKDTAPLIQRIFNYYVDGKSMQEICGILNAEGRRSIRNKKFTINSIRGILKNRAYIGEYEHSGVVIPDGMPRLISDGLFNQAQDRLGYNKKFGAQNAKGLDDDNRPRFWLTGKLYCGECSTADHEEPMQGTSGTSKTGAKHYYYSCNDQHKGRKGRGCRKKPVKKDWIEELIIRHLSDYLNDPENLASLAVDISEYYRKEYEDSGYLRGLQDELKITEKALDNVIAAVIAGASGERINSELRKLEERKKGLTDAIEAEQARERMVKDEVSIKAFFDRFMHADLYDPENRDLVLNYFVDKIYLYDDRVVITGKYDDNNEAGYLFFEAEKQKKGSPTSRSSAWIRKESGH